MNQEIQQYNLTQSGPEGEICQILCDEICRHLPEAESKIWHAHPVWFLNGNPVVGYSNLKSGIRLFFWSGATFEEEKLKPGTGKFKDASVCYNQAGQIVPEDLKRWLSKARTIQWDYKNLVKRKGELVRLC